MSTIEIGFGHSAVVVIETLPPGPDRTGQTLFDKAIKPLSARHGNGYEAHFREAMDLNALHAVLGEFVLRELCQKRGLSPIIHLECHGGPDGFQLASNQIVPWQEIEGLLARINRRTRLNTLVVLAACDGVHLAKLLNPLRPAPFWGVIGPLGEIPPLTLRDALEDFYRRLFSTEDLSELWRMLDSTGSNYGHPIQFVDAPRLFKEVVAAYLESLTPERLLRRAENISREKRVLGAEPLILDPAGDEVASALRSLTDLPSLFARMRDTFFMCEDFPDHRDRFPFYFEDFRFAVPEHLQLGE